MTDTWNPTQYNKFQREREQPFFDLLAMVRAKPRMRIADLGCGTGRPTRLLHEKLDAEETIGIDRSANMLSVQSTETGCPGLRFEVDTIESFPGERGAFDLIFSNAALHWLSDHRSLLRRLAGALKPTGQLAFQVPASHDQPSHIVAAELAASEPYRTALGGWRREQPVLSPEQYARILFDLGFVEQHVRLVVYPHVLAAPEEVIEWMKGTLLTEYERRMSAEWFEQFLSDYRSRLLACLERRRPAFFPFKRILGWAQRS
jgi:trans-aconitate 2-methyltransferase